MRLLAASLATLAVSASKAAGIRHHGDPIFNPNNNNNNNNNSSSSSSSSSSSRRRSNNNVAIASAAGPPCSDFGIQCRTGAGASASLQDSILNLTEIVWVGPETKQIYVGSPSIWRLPGSGELVASHDFFFDTLNDTVQVFIDRTGRGDVAAGAVWENAGNVSGMYWANLFTPPQPALSEALQRARRHSGGVHGLKAEPDHASIDRKTDGADPASLYLLGVSSGDRSPSRSIVISRSDDKGATWTMPSVLMPFNGTLSYHCAPTPTLTAADGRLYRAFESTPGESALILRTREPFSSQSDLLDASTWEATPSLPFDQTSMLPASWKGKFGWQEGNAVERFVPNSDGTSVKSAGIVNILRLDGQTTDVFNKAVILNLTETTTDDAGELVFDRVIDFPSTESKFVIRYHAASATYYSLTTDVTALAVKQNTVYARNHLSLVASSNLYDWKICDTILDDDTGFTNNDSARYTGFHYVDWIFDETGNGADLLAAVRTGYRGANTFHNANRMTFKRVPNFVQRCTEPAGFSPVGGGWCRPATNFTAAGTFLSTEDCAEACRRAGASCQGFANGFKQGCALYPERPTNSSKEEWSFQCHAKTSMQQ